MVQCIDPNRIVPVQEDLTTDYDDFQVIRGWGKMHRVDKKVAAGISFTPGEWAVLGTNGELTRPTTTPALNTYPVLSGTDRFDAAATGQATIIMSSSVMIRTTKFDNGATYAVGDYLTVKDLGGGEAYVTKAAATEAYVGRVTGIVAGDYIEFETGWGNVPA